MSDTRDEWVPFGTMGRAHGVRGEIRLVPHHGGEPLPDGVAEIGLRTSNELRVLRLTGVRPTSGALLVRLDGVVGRDAAQALTGTAVLIRREHLPVLEDGEFYLFELEGVRVESESGEHLGRVQRVQIHAAQDLLVIDSSAGERLLPLVPETVVSFDRGAQTLVVAVAAGLWDAETAPPVAASNEGPGSR